MKPFWRKIKNWVGLGKLNKESAPLEEFGAFMESAAPVPVACTFLTGAVADPLDCQCDDCRALARKLQETAESSFGQNLQGGANSLSGVLPSSSVNDVPREPVVANLTRGKTGLKQYKKWRKLSRGVAK